MTYADILQLYFDRSDALQWYWTLYVIIIGGLLAFSSLRQRPHVITAILVTILYASFAYKNLGAIRDVTFERYAILELIKDPPPPELEADRAVIERVRGTILPTLNPVAYGGLWGARNFHVTCDILTIVAVWAMELRRRRAWAERERPDAAAPARAS